MTVRVYQKPVIFIKVQILKIQRTHVTTYEKKNSWHEFAKKMHLKFIEGNVAFTRVSNFTEIFK